MALSLARIAARIRKSLGGQPESSLPDIVNPAGEFLVALHPWGWLERQQVALDFVKNQPFVRLPFFFPRELRHVTSWRCSSRNRSFAPGTAQELLDVRSDEPPAGAFRVVGAIAFQRPTHPNLLLRTESLHEGAPTGPVWLTTGTISVAIASGASDPLHPVTGEKGVAKLTASSGGNFFQDVPAARLKDKGVYWLSGYLRADGAAGPTRSTVQLAVPGSGTLRTCANIVWGAVPTIVARVSAPVSAGAGLHTVSLTRLQDGWVRFALAVTRDMVVDAGVLRVIVQPVDPDLAEVAKIVYVTGLQLELIDPYFPGAPAPDGPGPYRATISDEYPSGGAPVPVLEIAPVPVADEPAALVATFAGGWPYIDNDSDQVSIPDYLNGYFLELCVEWARGLEEQDREPLSVRLASRMAQGNPMLEAAIMRDLELQPELGPLRNGAIYTQDAYSHDWESGSSVAGP